MFDLMTVIIAQTIKPKAILLWVDHVNQLTLHTLKRCGVSDAFEHGVLHSLTIIDTMPRNPSQPATSSVILGIHIISYHNEHTHHFQRNAG